jgi:hypothetical protein
VEDLEGGDLGEVHRYPDSSVIVEERGFVLRRNWIPVVVSLIALGVGLVFAQLGREVAVLGWLLAYFGGTCAPLFVWRNAFPRARPVVIRASVSGVSLDDEPEIRAEDILEAKIVTRTIDAIVELAVRDRKKVVLRLPVADAKTLVDLVGARRTRFRLVASYGKRFVVSLGLLALLELWGAFDSPELFLISLPGLALWAALIAWLVGFVRGRLVVGADGFTMRWLLRDRFVAFRDVATVQGRPRRGDPRTPDTLVTLASGKKLHLRAVEQPNGEEDRGTESRALLGHLNEAFLRSGRLQDGSIDLPSLVERGTRTEGEWLSGLDALVRGGGSRYRVAAVSAEMLVQVATDPSATIESRVGASAALVRMEDEALRTRVRVAAEGCAAPELRDTLLALADARDESTTQAALARVARR